MQRAFKALCLSTHLYGRRLVLEWASTEEDIDAIRKRTADNFLGGKVTHVKRQDSLMCNKWFLISNVYSFTEPANKNMRKSTFSLENNEIEDVE